MNSKSFLCLSVAVAIFLMMAGCSGDNTLSTSAPIPEVETTTPETPPTSTPLPTPDPLIAVLEQARQNIKTGDSQAAVIQLTSILQESLDPSIRMDAINALTSIGTEWKLGLDEIWNNYQSREERVKYCGFYQEVRDVFEPVLSAEDRPSYNDNQFYINAAETDVILIDCAREYLEPGLSYTEAITLLLDTMKTYPEEHEIQQVFASEVMSVFDTKIKVEYATDPVESKNTAELITSTIGEFPYLEETISDRIFTWLLEQSICSGESAHAEGFGISEPKKFFSCDSSSNKLERNGLLGEEPGEIWFILEYDYSENSEVNCRGLYTTGNYYFTYSYPGQWKDIYVFKDIKTGKVVSKKTFTSTAPKCVFTSCDLNTTLKTASCQGGEGASTFDEAEFVQWLTDSIN